MSLRITLWLGALLAGAALAWLFAGANGPYVQSLPAAVPPVADGALRRARLPRRKPPLSIPAPARPVG